MNQKFNDKVQAWLAQDATERDYAEGAMLLLQLTGNQIMYRNLMANPRGKAPFIEYQLKKRLSFRLQQVTHEQVESSATLKSNSSNLPTSSRPASGLTTTSCPTRSRPSMSRTWVSCSVCASCT